MAPSAEGAVSCGHLCEAEALTEAAAETLSAKQKTDGEKTPPPSRQCRATSLDKWRLFFLTCENDFHKLKFLHNNKLFL